jgi:hypothetical protein
MQTELLKSEARPHFDRESWNEGYTRGYVEGHAAGEHLGEQALKGLAAAPLGTGAVRCAPGAP